MLCYLCTLSIVTHYFVNYDLFIYPLVLFQRYFLELYLITYCLGCLNCNVFPSVVHSLKKAVTKYWKKIYI